METVTSEKIISMNKRLQLLSCPFTEDTNEEDLIELLLHPNDKRVKLLSWILTNFDGNFKTLLDESIPLISNRIDSTHQKLLLALNIMGLSKADDLELIRGTASQKKQIQFWDELIDIFYMSQTGSPYLDKSQVSQDSSYCLKQIVNNVSVHDSYKESCSFIDTLVRKHKVSDIFSSELKLFSPDLDGVLKETKNTQVPTVAALKRVHEEMLSVLAELNKEFEEIKSYIVHDDNTVDNYCRKLDLTLKTFSQMIDNYLYCHSNDIEAWCRKGKKPVLSELGPTTKNVTNAYSSPHDLMNAIGRYNNVSSYLCDKIKKDLEITTKVLDGIGSTVDRETCTVMQNSISRRRLSSK